MCVAITVFMFRKHKKGLAFHVDPEMFVAMAFQFSISSSDTWMDQNASRTNSKESDFLQTKARRCALGTAQNEATEKVALL